MKKLKESAVGLTLVNKNKRQGKLVRFPTQNTTRKMLHWLLGHINNYPNQLVFLLVPATIS